MPYRSERVQMKLSFDSNKILLKVLNSFYQSDSKKNKKSLLVIGNENGISFTTYEEINGQCKFFIGKELFSDYYVCESTDGSVGFCINYGLFLDFLSLSQTRGSRSIQMVSWNDKDHIILSCVEDDSNQSLAFEMHIPTLDFNFEENFENLISDTELKLNSTGEKLDLGCSLIDSTFETVLIEYDAESLSLKFMAESETHIIDYIITEDIEDCNFEIYDTNSHSYSAFIWRQLHSFLQVTYKSNLRIQQDGLLIVNMMIKLKDSFAHLAIAVNSFTPLYFKSLAFFVTRVKLNMQTKEPSEFLKSALGRSVRVKLNSGFSYKGVLSCLDGFMNIAMENCEESFGDRAINSYKTIFIRGNNVLYITLN